MTGDLSTGAAVLFGGWAYTLSGLVYFNDTWTFRSGLWTELATSIAPAAGTSPFMAFDSNLGSTLLFGGCGPNRTTLAGFWSFNGTQWSSVNATGGPNSRCLGMAATDPSGGGIVIFGGYHTWGPNQTFDETWRFYTMRPVAVATPPEWEGFTGANFSASSPFGVPPFAFSWEFGDGTSSASSTPHHSYAVPGTYNVLVTVTDALGVQAVASSNATQLPPLVVAAAGAPLTGPAPLVVNFTAEATGGRPPYQFCWGFPLAFGGCPPTGNQTAYFAVGSYYFPLFVTDSLNYTVVRPFNITATPAPAIVPFAVHIFANQTNCAAPCFVGLQSAISNGSGPFSYYWNFDNGGTAVTADTVAAYTYPGEFNVSLEVTNGSGEHGITSLEVTVTPPLSLTAHYSVLSNGPPMVVQFSATGSGGVVPYLYFWSFGDGTAGSAADPFHNYTTGGNYTVSVEIVDASGGHVNASLLLTVIAGKNSSTAPPPAPNSGITTEGWEAAGAASVLGVIAGAAIVVILRRAPPKAPVNPPG